MYLGLHTMDSGDCVAMEPTGWTVGSKSRVGLGTKLSLRVLGETFCSP